MVLITGVFEWLCWTLRIEVEKGISEALETHIPGDPHLLHQSAAGSIVELSYGLGSV